VAVDVRPDASLAVEERLTIRFHGHHRGLIRMIPVRYVRGGLEHVLRLDDIHVFGEAGESFRTEVAYPGRSVRIKAWVPGAVDAVRTLRILYRVRRGLLAFEDHDELYWNVTGDEWPVPIGLAEATVTLPGAVNEAGLQTIAYTGPRGAAGRDWQEERGPGQVTFRTTRPLRAWEGLTVVVGWPPGAVARPPAWREAWWLAVDHWPLGLPLVALAAMSLLWKAYGRDPRLHRSIKPEYGPPPGLTPAEAGTLIDQRAEPADIVATVVDLAVRGYLHVEPVAEDDFLFRRVKPLAGDPTLTPLERTILQKVFGEQLSLHERYLSELRRDSEYVFPPLRDAVYRALVAARLFPRSPYWVRQAWGWLGLALLFGAGILWVQLDRFGWPLPAGVGLSGLVVLAFTRVMPRLTWRGARLLVQLLGFQEFLERAEKDRLERLPADILHRWLPWAVALGVTEQWIRRFEGLKVEAPEWFRSRGPFELGGYVRNLQRFGRLHSEALAAARRGAGGTGGWGVGGSGFSGGRSGGGFGGGGGRTF
jgi:hypothetical protein